MTREYVETVERRYEPVRKKDGAGRFIMAPVTRILNMTKPKKDAKKERAEA